MQSNIESGVGPGKISGPSPPPTAPPPPPHPLLAASASTAITTSINAAIMAVSGGVIIMAMAIIIGIVTKREGCHELKTANKESGSHAALPGFIAGTEGSCLESRCFRAVVRT